MTKDDQIERLSAEIHKCYCRAYDKRFGNPYWTKGDYSKLEEATKDYDREMARWHLEQLTTVRNQTIDECAEYVLKNIAFCGWSNLGNPKKERYWDEIKIAEAIRKLKGENI